MPYKDPEKRKAAFKKYYEKHKDKILEKNRKWAADNPEKHAEIERKGYARRTDGSEIIHHDTIDEALESLVPAPQPEPEPEPEVKPEKNRYPLTDEEVAEMLKDLKA